MALLVLGLVLWTWPHLMKEYTPGFRARLSEGQAKGMVAVATLVSIVLMVIGYRTATYTYVYAPPSWGQHANNAIMLLSVAFFGAANSKSHLRGVVRHPMFTGVILWAVAHLLVRGDLTSIVLWGGMILWAIAGWIISNRNAPEYTPFAEGTFRGDAILAAITLVVYVAIGLIHGLVGPSPFPM